MFVSPDCLQEHVDHHEKTLKASSKVVRQLLKKCQKILKIQKNKIDELIEKIDSLEQALEYDHEKILEIFEIMNLFSEEFLVPKETVDFLIPYVAKVEAQ